VAIKKKKRIRKLTDEQVREMRDMYFNRKYTYDIISKKFGVSLNTAFNAIRRINYRWIKN
jgi:transposase-like protein